MASIGNIAIKLTADPGGAISGLQAFRRELQSFGQSAGNLVAAPGRLLQNAIAGPMQAVEAFLGPIKNLASSIPLLGAAFAALPISGAGFTAFLEQGLQRVADLTKLSDNLGFSTETLGALVRKAGGDMEGIAGGLTHFSRTLTESNAGDKESHGKFRSIGIDPASLQGLSPEQSFGKFLDQAAAMPDQAQRLDAAFRVMGRSAGALAPVLAKGSEGLQQLKDKMAQTGQSFSNDAGTMARLALQSIGQIGQTVQGLQTQLAVQLAPFIKAAADKFNEMTISGKNMGAGVSSAIEGIGTGIAFVIDSVHAIGTAWKYVELGFNGFLELMTAGLVKLIELMQKLPQSITGSDFKETLEFAKTLQDELHKGSVGLANDIDKRALDPSASSGVKKFFDDIRTKAQQAAAEAKKTAEATNSIGQGAAFERGFQRIQQLQTPLEKFQQAMRDIDKEFKAGAYGAQGYARAVTDAFDQMAKASHLGEASNPHFATMGSQEAYSTINRTRDRNSGPSVAEILAQMKEENAQKLQELIEGSEDIVDALKNQAVVNF